MVTAQDCARLHPLLRTDDILGAVYSESDGSVDPAGLTAAYVKGARDGGVVVEEGCRVEDIVVEGGRVRGSLTNVAII